MILILHLPIYCYNITVTISRHLLTYINEKEIHMIIQKVAYPAINYIELVHGQPT